MASSSEKWGTKSRGLLGVVQVEGEEPCELKQSERGPLMRLQEPGQLSCLVLCWGCTRCWGGRGRGPALWGDTPLMGGGLWKDPQAEDLSLTQSPWPFAQACGLRLTALLGQTVWLTPGSIQGGRAPGPPRPGCACAGLQGQPEQGFQSPQPGGVNICLQKLPSI